MEYGSLCNVMYSQGSGLHSLGKTHADGEDGGCKENDIEDSLLGRLEQHRRDVNRVGRN